MTDYIDKAETLGIISTLYNSDPVNNKILDKAHEAIVAIPAADVQPVKHGRWVTKKDTASGEEYTICSCCETEIQWRDRHGVLLRVDTLNAPYCPNCGADMREKKP